MAYSCCPQKRIYPCPVHPWLQENLSLHSSHSWRPHMSTDCHIMHSFFLSLFASWCHNISYGGNLQSNIPSICLCNCGIYQLDGALSAWDDLPLHCGRSNLIWSMHLSHKKDQMLYTHWFNMTIVYFHYTI